MEFGPKPQSSREILILLKMKALKIFHRMVNGWYLQVATEQRDLGVVTFIFPISQIMAGARQLILAKELIRISGNRSHVFLLIKETCILQAEDKAVMEAVIFMCLTCNQMEDGANLKTWVRKLIHQGMNP